MDPRHVKAEIRFHGVEESRYKSPVRWNGTPLSSSHGITSMNEIFTPSTVMILGLTVMSILLIVCVAIASLTLIDIRRNADLMNRALGKLVRLTDESSKRGEKLHKMLIPTVKAIAKDSERSVDHLKEISGKQLKVLVHSVNSLVTAFGALCGSPGGNERQT